MSVEVPVRKSLTISLSVLLITTLDLLLVLPLAQWLIQTAIDSWPSADLVLPLFNLSIIKKKHISNKLETGKCF